MITAQIQPVRAIAEDADTVNIVPSVLGPPPTFLVQIGRTVDGEFVQHAGRSVAMTPKQWEAWPSDGDAASDEAYMRACVLANLGFAVAS